MSIARFCLSPLAFGFVLTLAGCQPSASPGIDEDLARADLLAPTTDPAWDVRGSVHVGESQGNAVDIGGRHVWQFWADGSNSDPMPLTVSVASTGSEPVRAVVLGPLLDGGREVLAIGGYDGPTPQLELTAALRDAGEYLVVIGGYELANWVGYELRTDCHGCAPERTDVLASPKAGALLGSTQDDFILIESRINPGLALSNERFLVELWQAPPARHWQATLLAVSESSGDQANFLLPSASVALGDDLLLVVRSDDGERVYDSGTWARFAPEGTEAFARLDAIVLGDLGSIAVTGAVGFTEGRARLSLRQASSGQEIQTAIVSADLPGTPQNGMGAFEALFDPPKWLEDGSVNPKLPRDGDILSVGRLLGDDSFESFGCFEFCNDLAGFGTCTGGPRDC